jgi:imidazoleglycerol-phosphate dehydratase
VRQNAPGVRYAEVFRETKETRVQVVLDLDGGRRQDIATGIPFFDHMLELMAFHGQIDLGISAVGDLEIDDHHTIEDVGIVLGQALVQALNDDSPVERYGSCHAPMDEALVLAAVDISGRGVLAYDLAFTRESLGGVSTENVHEFFRAFAVNAKITLHLRQLAGENNHHICEAAFKGVGRALRMATRVTDRRGSSSTKGSRD